MARVGLKAEGYLLPGGIPGAAVIESLDSTNGIYLDNPEIIGLFDLLLAATLINLETRQKISDYVAAQLGTIPGAPQEIRHRWRLPSGVDPSDWFVNTTIEPETSADGYVRVWTTATVSTHPDAVMEV
jgi:hypothetical protein